MSKKTKIWLVVGALLVLVGAAVFVGAMMNVKWDFKKLSTANYETKTHEITENFKDISVVTDTADVEFLPSENSNAKIVCYEEKSANHLTTVEDGALVIKVVDERKWYEHISINLDSPKITVYLPKGEHGALFIKGHTGNTHIPKEFKFKNIDIEQSTGHVTNYASVLENIKIETDTGDINIQNVSAFALDLSVSTGKVNVADVNCENNVKIGVSTGKSFVSGLKCKNLISSGSTGDILLKDTVASEKFFVERSTGDVKLEKSDAAEIFIKTDTGRVSGTLLTDKVFVTESDTGKISVPNSISGGRCEITTDTGDIKISIS